MGPPYTAMSDEAFYDALEAEVAEAAGVAPEQLAGMCPSAIEERLGVTAGEPHVPRGTEGRYPRLASGRYDVMTAADLAERRERVNRFLYGERPGYRERVQGSVAAAAGRVKDAFPGLF